MALINCPECNKEISDQAKTCPNCGCPIKKPKKPKKPINKKILILVLLICVIAGGVSTYFLLRPSDEDILMRKLCNTELKIEDIEEMFGKCENIITYDDVIEYRYTDIEIFSEGKNTVSVYFDNNNLHSWSISRLSTDEIDSFVKFFEANFFSMGEIEDEQRYKTSDDNVYGDIGVNDISISFLVRK